MDVEVRTPEWYSDPKNWTAPGIWKPPPFDVAAYQARIDRIVGLSASGDSIIRLSWAWDCRRWENYEWDEFGNAVKGEWRQKYRALTVELGNEQYVDISPPFFVLEERFEPGQYERSWNGVRYVHDPLACRKCLSESVGLFVPSQSCTRRDVHGAAPREGWYNLVPDGIIATHKRGKKCCRRLWKASREICYGQWKLPDETELNVLSGAVRAREKDRFVNPHEELSESALLEAARWGMQQSTDAQVAKREDLRAQYKDEVNTHGASIIPPQALVALKDARRRVPTERTWFS
jgi:hypothetical protein